jgi:N-formylglutamate deformylase
MDVINEVYTLRRGAGALVVGMPHVGTELPLELAAAYVPRAAQLEDTDWHLPRLYDFLDALDATVIAARVSRYVIDLNRPPDDAPMYPGAANTELCPTRFFTGEPLYLEGRAPDAAERARRRSRYWQPYHDALRAELARVRAAHGYVLLWDAHSIRSRIPWLFEGRLPDLNLGSAAGAAAPAGLAQAVMQALAAAEGASAYGRVLDGRFKGGYVTRHYGRPAERVYALQLELTQCSYMDEAPPFAFDEARAARLRPVLRAGLVAMAEWGKAHGHGG